MNTNFISKLLLAASEGRNEILSMTSSAHILPSVRYVLQLVLESGPLSHDLGSNENVSLTKSRMR